MRELVRESRLSRDDLIQPYFVVESDADFRKPIASMPGQFQLDSTTK
jgi:porphobilinogen synthase